MYNKNPIKASFDSQHTEYVWKVCARSRKPINIYLTTKTDAGEAAAGGKDSTTKLQLKMKSVCKLKTSSFCVALGVISILKSFSKRIL